MVSLPVFAETRLPFFRLRSRQVFRLRSVVRRPRSVTGTTTDEHPIIVAEHIKRNLVGFYDGCFGGASILRSRASSLRSSFGEVGTAKDESPILHSYIASHQLNYAFTHQRINQLPGRNFNKPLWPVFIICYFLLL
jgi:hypothetical protein